MLAKLNIIFPSWLLWENHLVEYMQFLVWHSHFFLITHNTLCRIVFNPQTCVHNQQFTCGMKSGNIYLLIPWYIMGLVLIDGLVQDCCNSSALAMELQQSCTKPSKWHMPGNSGVKFSEVSFYLLRHCFLVLTFSQVSRAMMNYDWHPWNEIIGLLDVYFNCFQRTCLFYDHTSSKKQESEFGISSKKKKKFWYGNSQEQTILPSWCHQMETFSA